VVSIADDELRGMAAFRLRETVSRLVVLSGETRLGSLRLYLLDLSTRLSAEEDRLRAGDLRLDGVDAATLTVAAAAPTLSRDPSPSILRPKALSRRAGAAGSSVRAARTTRRRAARA